MTAERTFEMLQTRDAGNERRIFWSELVIIAIVTLLVAAYLVEL